MTFDQPQRLIHGRDPASNTECDEQCGGTFEVPRDRDGSLEPQRVQKRQRRLAGLDEKVIALYARGMSFQCRVRRAHHSHRPLRTWDLGPREIEAQLEELYGVEISPALISSITASVMDDLRAWQARPLACSLPDHLL